MTHTNRPLPTEDEVAAGFRAARAPYTQTAAERLSQARIAFYVPAARAELSRLCANAVARSANAVARKGALDASIAPDRSTWVNKMDRTWHDWYALRNATYVALHEALDAGTIERHAYKRGLYRVVTPEHRERARAEFEQAAAAQRQRESEAAALAILCDNVNALLPTSIRFVPSTFQPSRINVEGAAELARLLIEHAEGISSK